MYVFVPAFQSLWSHHDVVNMHFRRYTNQELKAKLIHENLGISKSSYWNFSLFVPVYIFRKLSVFLSENKKEKGQIIGNTTVNYILLKLLLLENSLLKYISFPFKISTFCSEKKYNLKIKHKT